jgi:hypothetical protein
MKTKTKAETTTKGAQHTPGPWSFYINRNGATGQEFASIVGKGESVGTTTPANARLIAAAPALLEALQYAVQWQSATPPKYRMGKEQFDQARAAIAQATGTN